VAPGGGPGVAGAGRVSQGAACPGGGSGGHRPPRPVPGVTGAWIGAVLVLRGAGSGLDPLLAGVAEIGRRTDGLGGRDAISAALRGKIGDILKNSGNTFVP